MPTRDRSAPGHSQGGRCHKLGWWVPARERDREQADRPLGGELRRTSADVPEPPLGDDVRADLLVAIDLPAALVVLVDDQRRRGCRAGCRTLAGSATSASAGWCPPRPARAAPAARVRRRFRAPASIPAPRSSRASRTPPPDRWPAAHSRRRCSGRNRRSRGPLGSIGSRPCCMTRWLVRQMSSATPRTSTSALARAATATRGPRPSARRRAGRQRRRRQQPEPHHRRPEEARGDAQRAEGGQRVQQRRQRQRTDPPERAPDQRREHRQVDAPLAPPRIANDQRDDHPDQHQRHGNEADVGVVLGPDIAVGRHPARRGRASSRTRRPRRCPMPSSSGSRRGCSRR